MRSGPAISARPAGRRSHIDIRTGRDGKSCADAASPKPSAAAQGRDQPLQHELLHPIKVALPSFDLLLLVFVAIVQRLIGAKDAGDISLLSCLIR